MSDNQIMKTVVEEEISSNNLLSNSNHIQKTIVEDDSNTSIQENTYNTKTIIEEDQHLKKSFDSYNNHQNTKMEDDCKKTIMEDDSSKKTIQENLSDIDRLKNNDQNLHLKKGMVINGYKIDSIIGEGGMGRVYLAIHETINKRMAVKSLSPHLITKRDEFKRRFYDEAKIQASLEHPNIIQITHFIEQDSNFYLFMEYVEGESLEDLINRKKRLSDDEAIRIIIDVLKGLQHAHELGVIHRDIKPSNIMITRDGIAKIMDFGIAMMLEDVQVAKGSAGTIQYMSPEQISQPKNINHRSDIYSIGIVLYQLLTGRIPFKGKTEEIKRGHIFTAPPPIQESIYSELNTIVMKAMSKDSDDRFNDCKTFIQTLEEYLNKTHMECPHKKCNLINRVENKYTLTNEKCAFCGKKLKKSYLKMMAILSCVSFLLLLSIFIIHEFRISHVLVKDSEKEGLLLISQLNKKQALLSAIKKAKRIGRSGLIKKIETQLTEVSENIDDSCNRYNSILKELNQLFDQFVEKSFEDNMENNTQMIKIIYKHYQEYQSDLSKEKDQWLSDFTMLSNQNIYKK